MGRVYLCLGQNAELPYYFEKAKVHIWNIEELCYFIRENAWIMESELLTKELIDWVAQQCGLPKLAVLLNDSLKEEDCVTAFAACSVFVYRILSAGAGAAGAENPADECGKQRNRPGEGTGGLFPRIRKIFPRAAGI